MAHRFQFVTVSNPMEAPSSQSKKSAYSHAFRQAHAQRRREQVARYRKQMDGNREDKVFSSFKEAAPSPLDQAFNSNIDLFSSLSRPLSSAEYSLLHHYIHVIVPFTVGHCGLFDHPGDHRSQLLREWLGLAITDNALMTVAILLSTCRHILQAHPGNLVIVRLTLQYKHTCLRTIQQEMNSPSRPINILTVAKALALALDEVTVGDHTNARKHIEGVRAMVEYSGGAEKLGLTGLIEKMYRKLVEFFELEEKEVDRE